MLSSIKRFVVVFILSTFSFGTYAQTRVVVIPIGGDAAPLQNVITVSKDNGDFADPVAAVNSIKDASSGNPYLVVIGPGIYALGSQRLIMKEWVSIQGSGQSVTTITGTGNSDRFFGTIQGANNTELGNLTVENKGGNTYAIAIYNDSITTFSLLNVTAKASSGNNNYGIYSAFFSTPPFIKMTRP